MVSSADRFDVMVVGAGPAGSIAALTLARGGARVAIVDRAVFPRDKACGDLIGPRGLQVLADLGIPEPPGLDVGDMVVVGPTGRRVRLPSVPGTTYPGRARAVTRTVFDAALRAAALQAGAEAVTGRAQEPLGDGGRLGGFRCSGTIRDRDVMADVVIGADGATSRVAEVAGLVEPDRVLWGFAVRWYTDDVVDLPAIAWWEPVPRQPLPGYGWVFPGPAGRTNVGVGIGTLGNRRGGAEATRQVAPFVAHSKRIGLLPAGGACRPARLLGGWLKMGMIGTMPAAGNVLLVGDAAGLVNPLQGEGIAHAMASGRAAAQAVLAGPAHAADRYCAALADRHLPYEAVGAAAHRALVAHPKAVAGATRILTAPGIGWALAGGWSLLWNDLVDGAPPGASRAVARGALRLGSMATAAGPTRRWFERLGGGAVVPPGNGRSPAGAEPVGGVEQHDDRLGGLGRFRRLRRWGHLRPSSRRGRRSLCAWPTGPCRRSRRGPETRTGNRARW